MKEPEFPEGFCEEVCKREFPECAFVGAGAGLMCETCRLHLTTPYAYDYERKYLPLIRQYYKDVDAYEVYLKTHPTCEHHRV